MAEDKEPDEKTKKFIKAINPDEPKNPEGTTFVENLKGKKPYKGKHRDKD